MGYSCTVAADKVRQALMNLLCTKDANSWTHKGRDHFAEGGRENTDGAITGTIWREITTGEHKGRYQNIGGYRINPNGSIARFPGTYQTARDTAEALTFEAFVVVPDKYFKTYNRNMA